MLVDTMLVEARSRGYEKAQLWTHAGNDRARKLYEGRSFEWSGREMDDNLDERIVHYEREFNNAGPDRNWAPKKGYISTNCCYAGSGYRYVYQSFIWNDWRIGNLKRIDNNMTYEADATYNPERGTYLGSVRSWSSNLPRAYRDTEFLDGVTGDLRVLTVGTANAQRLAPNKYYYTSIRTTRGRQNTDGGGATGQIGYRWPSGCYRAACIFGRASDVLINVGDYRAPGSKRYVSYN